jgi:hypothetical protein
VARGTVFNTYPVYRHGAHSIRTESDDTVVGSGRCEIGVVHQVRQIEMREADFVDVDIDGKIPVA